MDITLDFTNGTPIYRQIVGQIKYLAVAGRLRPGDKVLSVRELAFALKVNPTTVMRAYADLIREGALFQRRGLGCFVAESVCKFNERERNRILDAKAKDMVVEALRLGFDKGSIINRVATLVDKIQNEGEA